MILKFHDIDGIIAQEAVPAGKIYRPTKKTTASKEESIRVRRVLKSVISTIPEPAKLEDGLMMIEEEAILR